MRVIRHFPRKAWRGRCPICEKRRWFVAFGSWNRDYLKCLGCWSIPRERALMRVIQMLYPDWRDLRIHESSPGKGGASRKLAAECRHYVASQYDPQSSAHQDLEAQTFPDASFDLVITQDVFEHLFHPDRAIAEIVRTLKPAGGHIMSVPIVRKDKPTRRRAEMKGGQLVHRMEPEYHRNPVDPNGSLVTMDWGYDIAEYLTEHGGPTAIYYLDDPSMGIRAEYIEILVTRKPSSVETVPKVQDSPHLYWIGQCSS